MTNAHAFQEAASRTTGQVDSLFLFIAGVCLFFFVLVEGLLIYFAVRYRRRKGEEPAPTPDIRSNVILETVWVLIPTIVVVVFFYYGFMVFRDIRAPAPGAVDIHVTGRQFFFTFRYPDGRKAVNELRVPVGKPVKLVMTSDDVIHSFYVPAYRIKQDLVPGQYTTLYLHPDRAGTYDVLCAEYCGVGHSNMRASLIVMEPDAYARWQTEKPAEEAGTLVERGRELAEKSGCLQCHAIEGEPKVGPNFGGLIGRKIPLADGTSVTADEEYVRESILDPNAKVVKGYAPVMPTFKGSLSTEDVSALIAFLKSLSGEEGGKEGVSAEAKEEESPAEKGRKLAESFGCLGCHSTDGSRGVGPTWKGLSGRTVELAGGGTVTADEAYLRESILHPAAKLVKGFPDDMPPFEGQIKEEDLSAILAYIKTLK